MRSAILILTCVFLSACEKKTPVITAENPLPPKTLVVEKFTAVQCPSCPAATELLEVFSQEHPNQIITVSIYNDLTGLGVPVNANDPDLNFPDAALLKDHLGEVIGLPTATFNRTEYEPGNLLMVNRTKWELYKDDALLKSSPASITITNNFDEPTRELQTTIDLKLFESIEDASFITVYLTEDNLVAGQKDHGPTIDNYIHEHVLRAAITNLTGDAVTESTMAEESFQKVLSHTIPMDWDASEMKVVVLFHKGRGEDREIIQSAQKRF